MALARFWIAGELPIGWYFKSQQILMAPHLCGACVRIPEPQENLWLVANIGRLQATSPAFCRTTALAARDAALYKEVEGSVTYLEVRFDVELKK